MTAPGRGGRVLVALLVACAAAASCFAGPVDDLLAVGKKAFSDGQYPLAVSSFQRIQDEYPESPRSDEASYLLGVSLFYAGRWAECLSAFSLLGIRHPQSSFIPRMAWWVGDANLRLGNWQPALDNLSEFLRTAGGASPFRLNAVLDRAVALEGLGRDGEAAAAYRQLLADPSAAAYTAEATFRLAGTEYRAGRFAPARDLYGKVLLEGTDSRFVRDAVFLAGECELALGRTAEAEKRFMTVLSLYPDSPYVEAASFRLVDIAGRQGRASTLRQADDYLGRFPGGAHRGSALRLKGDILLSRKMPAEALAAYTQSVAALPDGLEKQSAWYSMALAQTSLGRKLDAADSFARAAAGGSSEIAEKAGFQRAVILAGEGRSKDAIEALRGFLQSFPRSSRAEEAGRLLGKLLAQQGDPEASRAQWDSMARLFPGSRRVPEYLYSRAQSLLALGRWAPALDDFQHVMKDAPGSAWAGRSAYSIGYVYAQRGEYPRALPFFRTAASVAASSVQGDEAGTADLSAAFCLFNMGRFDQALSAFRSLQAGTARGPTGIVALSMGRSLYRLGRLDEAAAQLNAAAASLAAERSPLGADAHYWRGWALLRLRKPADAYSSFLAVAEGYPSDPRRLESLFRAAVCETMQGNDAAAVPLYEEVITTPRPSSGAGSVPAAAIVEQAMYERVQALARLGRADESDAALDQLAGDFPSGRLAAQAFYSRAEKALAEGRFADAHAGFTRTARGFPGSPLAGQAAYWAAESLLRAGNVTGALDEFWACLASRASTAVLGSAIEGFTTALRAAGDAESARRFSQDAAASRTLGTDAAAGVRLAAAEILLPSAPDEALGIVTDVRRAAPPEPFAGQASLLMGMYAASRSDWSRALDILGALEGSRVDDVGARAALEKGRALESMGRTADAVDEYLKVAYLFPDLGDRAAEGMASAARVSRARGDTERAARIEQVLRKSYPGSPWTASLPQQ